MSKKKSPELPDVPQYREDPRFTSGLDQMFGLGSRYSEFEGLPSQLEEAISTSPEMSRMFMEGMKLEMDPIMADVRRDITNQLAAAGQLTSSTFSNKLMETEQRYGQGLTRAATQFGIADIERAMRNRMSLAGMGGDLTTRATGMAGEAGQQQNLFNLQNYENIVAKQMAERKPERGGLFGGLTGAAGGGLAGLAAAALAAPTGGMSLAFAAPFIGGGMLAGGGLGAFGPKGTGMGIAQGGAGMFGARPGATAGAGGLMRSNKGRSFLEENWAKGGLALA